MLLGNKLSPEVTSSLQHPQQYELQLSTLGTWGKQMYHSLSSGAILVTHMEMNHSMSYGMAAQ